MSNENTVDYILQSFQENAEKLPDDKFRKAEEKLYNMLNDSEYEGVVELLTELENDYVCDFSEIKEFVNVVTSDDLFKSSEEDNDKSDDINLAVKHAVKSRIGESSKDKIVSYLNESCSNKTLHNLSKDVYYEYGKSSFYISPNEELEGRISMALTETKDKFRLFEVYERDEKGRQYRFFGEKNKKGEPETKIADGFLSYRFVSDNNQEYLLLSKEPLDPQRCKVIGQVYEVNDSKKIGDNRQVSTSQDVIFAHTIEPSIKELSDSEMESVKQRYDHDKLVEKLLGKFRHPDWFEKFLLATQFVNEENDFPSGVLWQAETRTGKTMVQDAMANAQGETSHFSGSCSTIKGLTPSFAESPPRPGQLLQAQRIANVDEFFNLVRNVINTGGNMSDVFRPLLDLLAHRKVKFGSGNGSITAKMEAVFFATTNDSYGIENMIDFVNKTDEAFAARLIMYDQTQTHIEYVNKQKKKFGNWSDEEMMPEFDEEFVSLLDTLRDKVFLNRQLDMDRIYDIKDNIKNSVPADMMTVYKNGYDHHIKNLVCGVAKYHTIVNNRDGFEVRDEDYETVEKILGIIVNSWSESIKYDLMKPHVAVEYLRRRERVVYDLISKNHVISLEELQDMTATDKLERILRSLDDKGVIKKTDDGNYSPFWYAGESNIN